MSRTVAALLAATALSAASCVGSDAAIEELPPDTREPGTRKSEPASVPSTDSGAQSTDSAPQRTNPSDTADAEADGSFVAPQTAPPDTAPIAPAVDPESSEPTPASELPFEPCGPADCATVEVPIDVRQPELGTLDIAINVVRSADSEQRVGYLLVNPGGPGFSGKEFATAFALGFPPEISAAFDIVGFDPRGVGESTPTLDCGDRESFNALTDTVDDQPDTPEEVAAMEAVVQRCVDSTGPAAGYLGTQFVADDMDAIRAALGAEQISYYGASYGSQIGVWYATQYPERVRSMVVDGAGNPVDELDTAEERLQSGIEEVRAIEDLLQRALDSCDTEACPIYNDGDPVGYYRDAMGKIGLVDEARPNLVDAGLFGVISTLYTEATWPGLHEGVFALNANDDPSPLAAFSDLQASDSAVSGPEWINCLDSWALFPDLDRSVQLADAARNADDFDTEFPLLSVASVVDDNTGVCPFLDSVVPAPPDRPLDGADVPMLVIGNPSDPFTPFTESVELVEDTLSNGYLLEADNAEHVVYGRGNGCVDDLVHRVLIDGEVPADRRIVCERS